MILLRKPGVTHAEALTPATALVIDNEVIEGLTDSLDPRPVDTSKPPQHRNLVVADWPIHVSTLADARQERVRWSWHTVTTGSQASRPNECVQMTPGWVVRCPAKDGRVQDKNAHLSPLLRPK
jgi:hypothetical protein